VVEGYAVDPLADAALIAAVPAGLSRIIALRHRSST
jgi:hypothetical protein